MKSALEPRLPEIAAWAAEGKPVRVIVELLCSTGTPTTLHWLRKVMDFHGVPRRTYSRRSPRPPKPAIVHKASAMADMYRAGLTLKQVGKEFNCTREYVRLLLKRCTALTSATGGAAVVAARKRTQTLARKDAQSLARHGCTYAQLTMLRQMAVELMARGVKRGRTPIGAFVRQKRNAITRNIPWNFKLWEWWQIWQESGKWEERGRGFDKYVMSRLGDVGAYEPGNVFITLAPINNSMRAGNKSGLPIGVRKNTKYKGYTALRQVRGKTYRLGSFPTPEAAHAAYLALPARLAANQSNFNATTTAATAQSTTAHRHVSGIRDAGRPLGADGESSGRPGHAA